MLLRVLRLAIVLAALAFGCAKTIRASGTVCLNECACPAGEICADSGGRESACRYEIPPLMRCVPEACFSGTQPDGGALTGEPMVVFDGVGTGMPRTVSNTARCLDPY